MNTDENWSAILRNIDSVLKTRVQGVSWFQFFYRENGRAHPALGSVPRWFELDRITPLAQELLELTTLLVQEFPQLGQQVEELVLVGHKRRLFIIPFGDLVLMIDAQEKIGDVCFHASWAEEDSPVGIRHYLSANPWEPRPLEWPQDIPEMHSCDAHISIGEQLLNWFEQPPHLLGLFQQDKNQYCVHKGSQDQRLWGLCVAIRSRADELGSLLVDQSRSLGEITEILIGQEGLRFTPAREKGSIVFSACSLVEKSDVVVVSSASLGSVLFSIRMWNQFRNRCAGEQFGISSTYSRIRDGCIDCGDAVRLPLLSQLTYNREKLDLETFCLDADINPLETPDVAGAILAAGQDVCKSVSIMVGSLQLIEVTIHNEGQNEPDLHVAISSVGDEIAYILISSENAYQFRNRVLDCLSTLQESMAEITRTEPFPPVDDLDPGSDCNFAPEVLGTFLQVDADINLHITPLGISNLRHLMKPDSGAFKSQRQVDQLLAGISELIDRVRIFLQFIVHASTQPWSVVLAGSQGCIAAYVEVECQKCMIGAACDPNMAKVAAWVRDSYTGAFAPVNPAPLTQTDSKGSPERGKKSGGIIYQDIKLGLKK